MVFQDTIKISPQEKGATDITDFVRDIIIESKIKIGICQLFAQNSCSSLLIHDTADENIQKQTIDFLAQLAPDNDGITREIDKSMDAIPEEMRVSILQTSVSFPISRGRPVLGIWQGIYLWEKTTQPNERKLTVTIIGE